MTLLPRLTILASITLTSTTLDAWSMQAAPLEGHPLVLGDAPRQDVPSVWTQRPPVSRGASAPLGHEFDQVYFDETRHAGTTWARGRTYKASFGAHGFEYTPFLGSHVPQNFPVHFELQQVTVGGEPLAFATDPSPVRHEAHIALPRGVLIERYELGLESIEQSFELPSSPGAGDIALRLAVETELALEESDAGYLFRGEYGGVTYGRALVFDAAGRSLSLETHWDGLAFVTTVPESFLATAVWPVIIDPVVGTFLLDNFSANLYAPSIANDVNNFLVVYQEQFSGSDSDIYAKRTTLTGSVIAQGYIDSSSQNWTRPDVAYSSDSHTYLVVAAVGDYPTREIHQRTWSASTNAVGAAQAVANAGLWDHSNPVVGGSDGPFCIVWEQALQPPAHNYFLRFRRATSSGALAPSAYIVASGGGTSESRHAAISKHADFSPGGASDWMIAWVHDDGSGSPTHIRGRRANAVTAGVEYIVASGPRDLSSVSVSSSTRSGTNPRYVFTFVEDYGTDTDVRAVLWSAGAVLDDLYVSALLPSTVFDDEYDPQVDCDGHHWVLSCVDRGLGASTYRSYATTLTELDGDLVPTEVMDQLTAGNVISDTALAPQGYGRYQTHWMLTCVDYAVTGNGNIWGVHWVPDWSPTGNHFCSSEAYTNSTGEAGLLVASGSAVAGSSLLLHASQLPQSVTGYYLGSGAYWTSGGVTPPGSAGFLCLVSPIARFVGSVQNSGNQGHITALLNTSQIPLSPVVSTLPGETWGFQLWHRDVPGTGSNFTNGIWVEFN